MLGAFVHAPCDVLLGPVVECLVELVALPALVTDQELQPLLPKDLPVAHAWLLRHTVEGIVECAHCNIKVRNVFQYLTSVGHSLTVG